MAKRLRAVMCTRESAPRPGITRSASSSSMPPTTGEGEPLERRAFLDGALHVERRRGLVFGVFKDRWAGFGLNDPDANFHGLTVAVRLPSVGAVHGPRWTVAADIVDCPQLELVLLVREEAVETPFLHEMR